MNDKQPDELPQDYSPFTDRKNAFDTAMCFALLHLDYSNNVNHTKSYDDWRPAFEKLRAESPKRESGWQPIETAPKDGTRILVDNPNWSRHDSPDIVWWEDGLWEGGHFNYQPDDPFVWMPVPKLPTNEIEEGSDNG